MSINLKFQGSVGMKIFLFSFKTAIKLQGRHKKISVGRVSGNTAIVFSGLNRLYLFFRHSSINFSVIKR